MNRDQKWLLHCSVDGGSASGQGLHVRVSEACYLQILLCLHDVGKSRHQTHCWSCLKQHDACKHTELGVKSLVHVELKSQILDLIEARKHSGYVIHQNYQ